MASIERERVAEWFRRFAETESAESPRYTEWALAIADDEEILDLIAALPTAKRQPVLILTCARVAGVPLRPFASIRDEWVERWVDIAERARTHATQTNDPRRCTPLMVALHRISGPIALIEVGASAGLTLVPDLYSYRWEAPGRTITSHPNDGHSSVTVRAEVHGWGAIPPRRPLIVYREGIDLNPLDVNDTGDREWLEALVWPEQHERLELVRAAANIVASVRPRLTAGDAIEALRPAIARARKAAPQATIVISSPAVLVYLDPSERRKFVTFCLRAKARWISLDGRLVIPRIGDAADAAGIDGDYLLSLDAVPIASVDPLGRRVTLYDGSGLTPDEVDVVEFERQHWGPSPSKESLVRKAWQLPLVRYYQRLYAIMESAAAQRYDPILVRQVADSSGPPNGPKPRRM